jgi:hypothetical protein
MTLKKAKAKLKPLGVTITRRVATGEYRVNFVGGVEPTAYYATDLKDAVETGEAMSKEARKNGVRSGS